jgi:TonB family protein
MLEVLFASRGVRTPRPVAGAVISTAVHAAVLVAMVAGAQRSAQSRLEDLEHRREEALLRPKFIIPPNRGAVSSLEQIRYLAIGDGTETDGVQKSRKKFDKHGDFGMPEIASAKAVTDVPTMNVPESALPDNVYSVLDVDSAAVRDPDSAAPAYPPVMMMKRIEGHATMRFVIDSTGAIDLSTVTLLDASHAEFVQAVREAMPRMRYRPAKMGLQAVRQLADQLFKFELRNVASSESAAASKKP